MYILCLLCIHYLYTIYIYIMYTHIYLSDIFYIYMYHYLSIENLFFKMFTGNLGLCCLICK